MRQRGVAGLGKRVVTVPTHNDLPTRPDLPARLRRLAALARARLIWETYAPGLARPVAGLILFLIVTVLGLWEVVGDPVRLAALLAVAIYLGRAIWRARSLRFPTHSDARRRLEETANLSHRPLDVITDTAALSPDVWPLHAARARADVDRITRVGRQPALTPMDRYGLRFILPALLALSLFLALGFGLNRIRHALSPSWLSFTNPAGVQFEAWVDPPDYTGRPPIYAKSDGGAIKAPAGSTFVVRATNAKDLPRPRYNPDGARARFLKLDRLGRESVEARVVVDDSATLIWAIGPRRQTFNIDVIDDMPPAIDITDPPDVDKRDRLVVTFSAEDEYGVDELVLEMAELRDNGPVDPFAINVQSAGTGVAPFKSAKDRTLKLDLTRHPLAGRKVIGRLVAIDGAGQRGESAPVFFTVPDKIFVEPLAKAIAEQRQLILAASEEYAPPPPGKPDMDAADGTFDTYQAAYRLDRAPEGIQRATLLIEAVTDAPEPGLFPDPVVYTGLRHAAKSMRYARSRETLTGLPDYLWELALRAEFGVLGTALQEMQEAQAALRDGIARRAPQREIDTLFERYNQAVDNYMEELRRKAIEEGNVAENQGGGQGAMGSTDEIQALLDAIEEANRNGDTEGARQALAQLAQLLENMQIQLSQGGGGGDGPPSGEMTEEMRENLEELAKTLGEQRELQDETRRAERDELERELFGDEPGEDSVDPQELAQRQSDIQDLLEGLREQLGEDGDAASGEGGEEAGQGQAGDDGEPVPGANGDPGSEAQTGPGSEDGEGAASGGEADVEGDGVGGRRGDPNETRSGPGTGGIDGAREAMRQAEEALRNGDLSGARRAQDDAIAELRGLGERLAREAGGEEDGRGESPEGSDPLGRSQDAFDSGNSEADIEAKDNATRSRELLEELRRRAAEEEREQSEKDYLDRLLKPF